LEALSHYMRRFLDSWDDWRVEATDYREAGDSFVVQFHLSGVGKGSGLAVKDRSFMCGLFGAERRFALI